MTQLEKLQQRCIQLEQQLLKEQEHRRQDDKILTQVLGEILLALGFLRGQASHLVSEHSAKRLTSFNETIVPKLSWCEEQLFGAMAFSCSQEIEPLAVASPGGLQFSPSVVATLESFMPRGTHLNPDLYSDEMSPFLLECGHVLAQDLASKRGLVLITKNAIITQEMVEGINKKILLNQLPLTVRVYKKSPEEETGGSNT